MAAIATVATTGCVQLRAEERLRRACALYDRLGEPYLDEDDDSDSVPPPSVFDSLTEQLYQAERRLAADTSRAGREARWRMDMRKTIRAACDPDAPLSTWRPPADDF